MHNEIFERAVAQLVKKDSRYPAQAYGLLEAALDYTVRMLYADNRRTGAQHVSGQQLANGFRDYVVAEYGPFSMHLMNRMNLHETDDLGNLVYNLVEVGAFGKTDKDRREDFHAVYDWEEAFREPFLPAHS